jgi:hypothetical protein
MLSDHEASFNHHVQNNESSRRNMILEISPNPMNKRWVTTSPPISVLFGGED